MFDILSQSALEIANGLVAASWGGTAPEGGIDFPSACVLSKSSDEYSDLHVELGFVETDHSLSDIPWLADVTHTKTRGPGDTNSPFKHPIGESPPAGIFGSALNAYGELVATCMEYGRDYSSYDNWFRSQWGIDKDTDLSASIPIVRSHGNAFWGGIGRKLAPGTYMHFAATKQIKVVWHGKGRKDFGENVLIDWPRLEAIAMATGAALLLEDRHARGRLKRIDFRLVTKELPKAPSGIGDTIERLPVSTNYAIRAVSDAAIAYVQGYRKHALLLAQNALGTGGVLEVEAGYALPMESLVKFAVTTRVPAIGAVSFLDMADASFDIVEPAPNIDVQNLRNTDINVFDAFSAVTRPFVDKNLSRIPEGWQIRTMILTYNSGVKTDREEAEDALRGIVELCVPDDFLLRIYRLYSVLYKDRAKGGDLVVALLKALRAPHNVFETSALVAAGVRVKRNARCLAWICESLATSATRSVKEQGAEALIAGALRRIMSSAANGDIALAEIIRRRKTFWANEYRRRASTRDKRKVEYQLKSRLFRVIHIVASIDSGVYVNFHDRSLGTVLESSAAAYLRKRKKLGNADPAVPDQGNLSNEQYCHKLDRDLSPKVTFASVWISFVRSADLLRADVDQILEYCAQDCNYGEVPPSGALEDTQDDEEYNEGSSDEEDEVAPDPEPITVEPVDEDVDGGFFDEDEEDDDEEEEREQRLDLVRELHEDNPEIEYRLLVEFAGRYGQFVTVSQYQGINEEVRATYLKTELKPVSNQTLDGFDIRDV